MYVKEAQFDYRKLPWIRIHKGGMVGRMKKRVLDGERTVRFLEISPEWNEVDWCRKEHIGYILSGVAHFEFESKKKKSLNIKKDQGFFIPLGVAHKVSSKTTARLFIVDQKQRLVTIVKPLDNETTVNKERSAFIRLQMSG